MPQAFTEELKCELWVGKRVTKADDCYDAAMLRIYAHGHHSIDKCVKNGIVIHRNIVVRVDAHFARLLRVSVGAPI